ncbi:MAG: hypothetical protein EU533_06200 [Promethearchaeota archaeon]|nr:MAG: hypothetical protein EU533_06200 [Candidatus Lokiarchaeota archaeon]
MFLDRLKESPKSLYLFMMFIAGFLLFLIINFTVFRPLGVAVTGYNILDYEFAWTPEQVIIIFATWGTNGMILQAAGVYWDFLYIIGYGSFAFSGVLLLAKQLSGKWQMLGLYVSFIAILAGLFDVIENIFLLVMLYDPNSVIFVVPTIAGVMATMKFSALLIALLYFIPGLVAVIIQMIKNKKN